MEYGRDPYKLPLPPVFPAAADDTEDEEVDVGGVVHCKKCIGLKQRKEIWRLGKFLGLKFLGPNEAIH